MIAYSAFFSAETHRNNTSELLNNLLDWDVMGGMVELLEKIVKNMSSGTFFPEKKNWLCVYMDDFTQYARAHVCACNVMHASLVSGACSWIDRDIF